MCAKNFANSGSPSNNLPQKNNAALRRASLESMPSPRQQGFGLDWLFPMNKYFAAAILFSLALGMSAEAQDRLKTMPGYDQYIRMQPLINSAVVSGAVQSLQWSSDAKSFTYRAAGKAYR